MTPDFDELIGTRARPRSSTSCGRSTSCSCRPARRPRSAATSPRRAPRIRGCPQQAWAIGGAQLRRDASSIVIGLAVGYAVGNGNGFQTGFTRPMHGVGAARCGQRADQGRRGGRERQPAAPDERALAADARQGPWYELYLTKKGKAVVPCGIFQTGRSGSAQVSMNAPADLAEYDGWIVTARVPGQPVSRAPLDLTAFRSRAHELTTARESRAARPDEPGPAAQRFTLTLGADVVYLLSMRAEAHRERRGEVGEAGGPSRTRRIGARALTVLADPARVRGDGRVLRRAHGARRGRVQDGLAEDDRGRRDPDTGCEHRGRPAVRETSTSRRLSRIDCLRRREGWPRFWPVSRAPARIGRRRRCSSGPACSRPG